ncbi:acyl-CoA dehydrogenase family protein [Camelimonas abortus]|uniref:Acyl-CoA dehydrogenase family protein n=1 Tax=Camelimonas abortus TaxID=1017184 RepID=A0ABV7LEU3_9HYPH
MNAILPSAAAAAPADIEAFRQHVRAWLRANLPEDLVRRNRTAVHPTRDDMLAISAILARNGWSVPGWPVEEGGTGWTPMQRYVFEAELVAAGAPTNNIQGVSLVGPVIAKFGTPEQKRRFLPDIREGRVYWAQGFSEPGAGSDLASLRTRAVREGDVYVVNGQKIWNSHSHFSDWIFCLTRTDPEAKPQKGISFLLIDLRSPGVTVRPIRSIDGGESLCEVFFDNVRVPVDNLVGEENRGWDYAKWLLGAERVATANVPRNKRNLELLKEMARAERRWGRPLAENADLRRRIAEVEIDLIALEEAVMQALGEDIDDPALPSVLKLEGTRIQQEILRLMVETLGSYGAAFCPEPKDRDGAYLPGLPHAHDAVADFLFMRAATIYGGSSEVQRNILARLLLRGEVASRAPAGEERRMLAESAAAFARRHDGFGNLKKRPPTRGNLRQTLAAFADMGWTGLGVPEAAGGYGGSAADIAVVAAELGRGLVHEPFIGCVVAPAALLAAAGAHELAASLVSGETVFAVAHDEPEARGKTEWVTTRARRDGDGWRLDGFKCMVTGAVAADAFLVSARTAGADGDRAGLSLFRVPAGAPGLTVKAYRTIDNQQVADLVLEGVRPGAGALVGAEGGTFAALDAMMTRVIMVACADAVGAMEQALWTTRDYLRARRQFGQALADFQALQHRLADMYVELELARASLAHGLAALELDDAERRRALVSASKARIGRAAFWVGAQGIQLHGGMGMTEECVIGHYFRRLKVFDTLYGDSHHHACVWMEMNDLRRAAA